MIDNKHIKTLARELQCYSHSEQMKAMQLYQYQYVPEGSQELGRAARKQAGRQTLIKNLERHGNRKSKSDHAKRNETRMGE